MCRLTGLALGVSLLGMLSPLRAQNAPKPTLKMAADLLGNGKRETITARPQTKGANLTGFTLTIDAATIAVPQTEDMDLCEGVESVQIDSGTRARQVVVTLRGPDDIAALYLFRYDGSRIEKIGHIGAHGAVKFPGNGMVYAQQWMGFWTLQDKYVVDGKGSGIRQVPQPLYYVGQTMTVTASFAIRQEQAATSPVVADVATGSRVTLLVYSSVKGSPRDDGQGWYLLKTQTGLCGWVQLRTFQEKQKGLTFAD